MLPLIKSEFQKIYFFKSSKLYLLFSLIFNVVSGLILAFTTKLTRNEELFDLNPISIIEINMIGVDISTILLIIFTAIQIGREFENNHIQLYLTLTPKREKYFVGKLVTFF